MWVFLRPLARKPGSLAPGVHVLLGCALVSLTACSLPFSSDDRPGATLMTHGDPILADEPNFQARGHVVSVDFNRLLDLDAPDREESFLRLPDGTELAFQVEETEGDPPVLWRGWLVDNGVEARLTLSRSGQRLAAGFVWQSQRYGLTTQADGTVVLWENNTPMPRESPTLEP